MNKARYIFAAGAVFLSTALAAKFFAKPQEPTPKVLTWNCEIPVYKPESITLTCADGGWIVHTITWSKWGIDGAEGTGIFREKLCDPSCAEGQRVEARVNLTLSELSNYEEKYYLRTLDIGTPGEKDFPWGRAGVMEWDVMEFAEIMGKKDFS